MCWNAASLESRNDPPAAKDRLPLTMRLSVLTPLLIPIPSPLPATTEVATPLTIEELIVGLAVALTAEAGSSLAALPATTVAAEASLGAITVGCK